MVGASGNAHPYIEQMLILPFWRAGVLEGLRFRRLSHDTTYAGVKYLALCGAANQVEAPFLATHDGMPMACGLHRGLLWVVEGELDTLSIRSVGRAAIGAPSANIWRPEWVAGWASIPHVVILKDADRDGVDAADRFVEWIERAARSQHGENWVQAHLQVHTIPTGEGTKDANDLLMLGEGVLRDALRQIEHDILGS